MKISRHFALLILVLLAPWAIGHAQWYHVNEVSEKVWVIDDHGSDNSYLVVGSDSALLIDTGLGTADLRSVAERITHKPLIVVNTHAHPDHVGANYQFEKVYIHPADSSAARSFMTPGRREGAAGMMSRGEGPAPEETYGGPVHQPVLAPVKEGHIFKLGGRDMEVMETPAHTAGGICLLDRDHKLLFSGDNNNSLVWLFLPGCLPLSQYLVTLEKQKNRLSEFDTIFPGHGPGMKSDFILDQIQCVNSILDGSCEARPYESFAGDAMICTSGRASVAYNPDNL
jgi:glyoxylase-like metal-dependent hydrolase (beta-lactamase superfamily II)